MSTLRSARDRARTEIRAEILATARAHLATDGAAALSLRAVARDLGLVSSAVYRYFENRDALLTALIVEAYDALGAAAEASALATLDRPPLQRWAAAAHAIRDWAIARPQEYALLYGSPVPGYEAPQDTVVPGTRVTFALLSIVRDANRHAALHPAPSVRPDTATGLDQELRVLSTLADAQLEPDTLLAMLLAWTQLFGLLSFELFGQTRGMVTDHGALFTASVTATGRQIGLPDTDSTTAEAFR